MLRIRNDICLLGQKKKKMNIKMYITLIATLLYEFVNRLDKDQSTREKKDPVKHDSASFTFLGTRLR